MGQVVWYSTLLILVLSCQGQETVKPNITCYRDMLYAGYHTGDRHRIMKDNTLNRAIVCDTHADGGGWIVIQRRHWGIVDFYRTWNEYKRGFGNPMNDFWLGNNDIYLLTNKDAYELLIEFDNGTLYAIYSSFKIESEANNYTLRLGSHSGTLSEESIHYGLSYSNGMQFSTKDRDNDLYYRECATLNRGAWWYNSCQHCDLNGPFRIHESSGMFMWRTGSGEIYANSTEMKIRLIPQLGP